MERLDSTVRRELGRFGPVDGDMVEVVRAWPGVVGETVARSAWPARLARDGTLHVNAVSSTWAFELGRMAPSILEALRAALGDASPPALKFVPGPVPEPTAEHRAAGAAAPPRPSAEHLAEGAVLAAAIEDEDLRATVARAAAASLAKAARERAGGPSDSRGF